MHEEGVENALTEIALALAMAFFAMMVLALLSVGLPETESGHSAASIDLRAPRSGEGAAQAPPPAVPRALVIYHRGRLLDERMRPVDPSTLPRDAPLLLAFPPTTTLQESLAARQRLGRSDLVVTTLTPAWIQRLEETRP